MKATELRIGNWIGYKSGTKLRESIVDILDLQEMRKPSRSGVEFYPIPLTEEWLLKFGFEKENETWVKDYFLIDSDDLKISFENAWGEDRTVKLQYVHQLQNLYFALTGEELIIK